MTDVAVTRELAEFAIAQHSFDDPRFHGVARDAFIDTVGVAVAGVTEPAVAILEQALGELPAGPSLVIASGRRTTPRTAALLNATSAHALDYDDVSHSVKGHPSTVLVPALLALAEERRPSGALLLESYGVGLQLAAGLWAGLGAGHYARGWHATSTIGVVAAAGASARLLGLTAGQTTSALGLAASFAAGSRQNFGTMTKPLHAGHAAEWGVTAALLAERGFTADETALEGQLGFFALFGDRAVDAVVAKVAGDWVLTGPQGLNVKKYPCCYFTHRALDAVFELPPVDPERITSVQVEVPPGTTSALLHPRPVTGLEAKFSGEYTVAAAIHDGAVTLQSFDEKAVQRSAVRTLMERITWSEVPEPPADLTAPQNGFAVVTRTDDRGGVATAMVDIPKGDCRRPLDPVELAGKFTSCLEYGGHGAIADAMYRRLSTLRDANDAGQWSADLMPAAR